MCSIRITARGNAKATRAVPLLIALALTALLFLSSGPLSQAADIELDFAMWIVEPAEIEPTQAILRTYEQLNPGVKINLIHQPWAGYHDKMMTHALAGTAPDVMAISRIYLPAFAQAAFLRPLTAEITPLLDEIVEVESGTYGGEIYGVPVWGGPSLWMYNGDLFDEAGLQRPPDYYGSGDWNWDTVVEIGKKLTVDRTGDGVNDVWALESPSGIVTDWVAKVRQFGGRVLDEDRTKAMINEPNAIQALTLWSDMALTHQIAPRWEDRSGVSLVRGNLALYVRYASEAVSIARVHDQLDLGLIPQPFGPAGAFHIAGGVPLTVSQSTEHPEEAAKFAIWYALYSDQWQLRGIPAARDIVAHEYRSMVAEHLENPDAIMHALSGPTAMEPQVGHAALTSAWDPVLHDLRGGRISPEEAAEQIAHAINAILAE